MRHHIVHWRSNRSALILLTAWVTTSCDSNNQQQTLSESPVPKVSAPTEENTKPLFVDVAQQLGVDFHYIAGQSEQLFLPEIVGAGVALFDFDGDGDLDIYALQGYQLISEVALDSDRGNIQDLPTNQLFRNELIPSGVLSFTDVSETSGLQDAGYGMGVAVGDIDSDGDPDMFVTNYGRDRLYVNNGDGTFKDVSDIGAFDFNDWTTSASFFDFDLDGDLDLIATAYVDFDHQNPVECWYSGGTGAREFCGPLSLPPLRDRLWRNDGDYNFVDISEASGIAKTPGNGLGVTATDLNRDGYIDIYVANDQMANHLWQNEGDGTFSDKGIMSGSAYNYAGAPEASMGLTAGDYDGDGDEDLFMTHLDGQTNTLMENIGDGQFVDRTSQVNLGNPSLRLTGFGTRFFDYDNDGWLDLFVANGAVIANQSKIGAAAYAQINQLFRNQQTRFSDVSKSAGTAVTTPAISRGAAFGDIDNDGDTDIVVTNKAAPLQILINQFGQDTPALKVELTGRQNNLDAYGARVALIRTGQPLVWRRVHTDGSYLSASSPQLLFGLGESKRVDGIGVIWPNGLSEQWPVPEKSGTQLIELIEGTGSSWSID